jgi:dTDP-4-dehydrorhamnose 3,5-epimerase
MIQKEATRLPGLFILSNPILNDSRGTFKKVLSSDDFLFLDLAPKFLELYYSVNKENVIRGMHFQIPPSDYVKMVYVVRGRILDVCIDLRRGESTYGDCFAIELSGDDSQYLYIPKGIAHGFLSKEDGTIVHYAQSSCYSRGNDKGILYDSFGFDWGVKNPIVSERDKSFPTLLDYSSPFMEGMA